MLNWTPQNTIVMDYSLVFGKGYDFFGLEELRQEAFHNGIGYVIWPERGGLWRVYETLEGGLTQAPSEGAAKAIAERWALEAEAATLRAKVAALVAAGKRILAYGNVYRYKETETSPYEQLKAAIAAAEGREGE